MFLAYYSEHNHHHTPNTSPGGWSPRHSELAFGVHGELEVNVDPGQRHVLKEFLLLEKTHPIASGERV